MRKILLTVLGVFIVEFIIAPIGGARFQSFFPQNKGIGEMMPDIPFYHWGYATAAVGLVALGFILARWPKGFPLDMFRAIKSRRSSGQIPIKFSDC